MGRDLSVSSLNNFFPVNHRVLSAAKKYVALKQRVRRIGLMSFQRPKVIRTEFTDFVFLSDSHYCT